MPLVPIGAAINIGRSLQQALDAFLGFLPNLVGFLIILVVGYLVAKLVKAVVRRVLEKVGVDRALHRSEAGQYVERVSPGASPAALIGGVVFWLIFIFVLSAAIGALKIPAVTAFMDKVLAYLPNVIVAVLIFVLAAAIAGAIGGLVHKAMGDTPTGRVVRTAVPALVMAIAVFMILNQLRIAPEIVTITYAALIGAVALGSALAFGLGGRGVAQRMLEDAYSKGEDEKDQVKRDLRTGRDRAQEQADQAQTQVAQPGGVAPAGPGGGRFPG
jgi:Mechanosensitive ion channel, conserved TM helix